MNQPGEAAGAEPRAGVFSGYPGVVLALLVLAYTFNFIDRTIISTIGQAIKVDLKLTDTQLGLLGGLSFALLYTLMGVPIARLAERRSRVWIITAALIVWSGFTAACGLAASFVQLLALRVGVGVGEAGCSPPAHSLISDYFPARRRASALSIYAFGIPLGAMIGAAIGGWLAKTYGWRIAFFAVGAPGLILAAAFRLIVREPRREAAALGEAAPPAFNLLSEARELGAVAAGLFGRWPIANIVLGITIASFTGYGAGQFAGPYFIRVFGLDYATVGLILGLIAGVSGGLGTLAGGFISDWASKRGARWYALTPAIGLAVAAPIYILAYRQPDWRIAAAVLLIPGVFAYTYLGPTFAVVQNVFPSRRRATAAAVLFLFLNIIALGGGPLFTGWMIDAFAQFNFNHPGHGHVLEGLASLWRDQHSETAFAAACPGGAAAAHAGAAMAGRCHAALAGATREGLVLTLAFLVWAALHYLLGSVGLARLLTGLAAARETRGTDRSSES